MYFEEDNTTNLLVNQVIVSWIGRYNKTTRQAAVAGLPCFHFPLYGTSERLCF